MLAADLIEAFDLPEGARVDRRIPKSLLLEHGAPTAADRRQISDGVERIEWVASLKPTTIGVAAFRDEVREYLEIAVLHLTMRDGARAARLIELVHRAIPYPLLLVTELEDRPGLSAAHKRWSQSEWEKVVVDGEVIAVDWDRTRDVGQWPTFREALALRKQPRTSLLTCYQGWIDTLVALQAARLTGVFAIAADAERAADRRDALRECVRLDGEIARLRATAMREKQMSRRVEINLALKRVEAARAAAQAKL